MPAPRAPRPSRSSAKPAAPARLVAGGLNAGPSAASKLKSIAANRGPANMKPTAGFNLKAQNANHKQQRVGNGRAGKG